MTKLKDGLYALYLRKSRADEEKEQYGKFETLARHEQELTELAKRSGYVLDKPYYKELVSGERIAERHEFQRLMEKVSAGEYKGILVHAIARLGRGDPMEYGWILFTLKRTNTIIITPSKVYDPNNQDDARYLQMEMFVSNMELGNIVSRLTSGCRASARNGCFIKPIPPYGYDRVRIDGKWTLAQNDNAPTVRMIFEQAASGVPLGSIARHLNDTGMRTPSGGYWAAGRLVTMISNPHYKGYIRYGYYGSELVSDGSFVTHKHQLKKDDCILAKGLHEGIVSEDLWQAANDRNFGSPPIKRDTGLKNPLAGLLVCKKCGRAMIRFVNTCKSNGNKIEHYRHAPFCDCKARGANMNLVISLLADALESIAEDYETRIVLETVNTTATELEAIEKKLTIEDTRLEKLIELYFAEAIGIDEFKQRREKSAELAKLLKQRRVELLREKTSPKDLAVTVRKAVLMLKDECVSPEAKNTMLKSFVDRIEYENCTVRQKYPDIRLNVVLIG